ncbi:uncharacterized protein LOC112454642 isoform X3 [Temnothorax curvispinosus]|uniref:Uncharacterized protein LOC112454642 isoform X3 n=1 Tax=Temnothorax curvispinosus TaxID=300111 RepID=A0A6J1PQ88_9HYME|nr:uncharacterized protein LOC112454642 isoform X3 [Temnothorax curvispinosus]
MRKISAEWSFLIFLWYVANTEPLRTLGDRFDVSISSIFCVIRRVVEWLLSRLDEEIKWPDGNDAILVTSQKFETKRDADMKFTNIYCGEPGSLHDARVLRRRFSLPIATVARTTIQR